MLLLFSLLEGRPLLRLLRPAPLHQLAQLLQAALQGQGGPEGGLLPPGHALHDLFGAEVQTFHVEDTAS